MGSPGRQPVHLVSTAKRVGGRQGLWQAMRKLRQFTLLAVADEAKAEVATVRTYAESLKRGGYLAVVGTVPPKRGATSNHHSAQKRANIYELIRDVGFEAPRVKRDGSPSTQGAAREQMWRAMKMLDRFNPRELALAATTDEHVVADVDARDYVKNLLLAGYLVVVEPATKRAQARYRFVKTRNTGPLPPQVQRLSSIWDANLRMVVWQEEPSE
jgi:hypothetical protein